MLALIAAFDALNLCNKQIVLWLYPIYLAGAMFSFSVPFMQYLNFTLNCNQYKHERSTSTPLSSRWQCCLWTHREHLITSPRWKTVLQSLPLAPWPAQCRCSHTYSTSYSWLKPHWLYWAVHSYWFSNKWLFCRYTTFHRISRKMICSSFRWVHHEIYRKGSVCTYYLVNILWKYLLILVIFWKPYS